MEPATMYLGCLIATFGVWLAGERVWVLASWMNGPTASFRSFGRLGSLGLGVVMAVTLWRLTPAIADVVPVRDRTVVSEQLPSAGVAPSDTATGEEAEPALTRYALPSGAIARLSTVEALTHTVVRGDCLWKIARSTLIADGAAPTGEAITRLWRRIYAENRDVVGDNPNLIFPGQVLSIPER